MAVTPGMRFGRYELLELLGMGGMGEVFRARDHDLRRDVAIKFLPTRYAKVPERMARFAQEARYASSLNHPNIVTIHEIGETAGQPFIVMEFVTGETLRARMQRERLPMRLLLDLGTQIADGLAKAHDAGIIHRDVKPENVMISDDGFVKILDFGLAKLRSHESDADTGVPRTGTDSDEEPTLSSLTAYGTIFGTAGYMSPEQAAGKPVDFRSDQFSLGSILYEMITGRQPFKRDSVAQTLTAIIENEPVSLVEINPSVPAPARWIVARCLAKSPAERYASTQDLARELKGLREHLSEATPSSATLPPIRRRARGWLAILAAVLATVLILTLTPMREVVLDWLNWRPLPVNKRVAILPVRCPSGTPEDQATCDGLLDYVVARLGMLERYQKSLAVVPAVEVRQSGVTSAPSARRGLGATLAVDLTVQRSGDQMVLIASLLDTGRQRQIRAATRQFRIHEAALLDQSVEAVVELLDLELGTDERKVLRVGTTSSPEASAFYAQASGRTPYQQARSALERANLQASFEDAIGLFNKALELDPRFAFAHAGLGQAYLGLYRIQKRPQDAELSEAHCRRALELDDLIPAAWLTLGSLHIQLGKFTEAQDELSRALARDPRNGRIYSQIAYAYQRQNRPRDAEETYLRALALSPDFYTIHAYYGSFLYSLGRYTDAERALQKARELAPDNPMLLSNLGGIYQMLDRKAEARMTLQKSIAIHPSGSALSNLARLEFQEGRYHEAARLFEQAAGLDSWDCRIWRNAGTAYARIAGAESQKQAAYRKALELGEKEQQIDPKSADVVMLLADCHAQLGEAAEARRLIDEADKLAPANAGLAERAAEIYEDLGDRERALHAIAAALERGYPQKEIERSVTLERLRTDPRYRPLAGRSSPSIGPAK